MEQWVKNYNTDVIKKLNECEEECLDGYDINITNDPTVASHSVVYDKTPTATDMTL